MTEVDSRRSDSTGCTSVARPRRARRRTRSRHARQLAAANTCRTRGTKDRTGDGRRVRRDTIFRIASMTKPVTAVAAMILVEEVPAPARRTRRLLAARARRPPGAARARQSAGRHRSRDAAHHGARRAHVPHGPRDADGRARHLSGAARVRRPGTRRRTTRAAETAGTGRVDAPVRHPAARAPARGAVDLSHQRGRVRCARRARGGPAVRRRSSASASSTRSRCATPRSACRPRRSTGSRPAT